MCRLTDEEVNIITSQIPIPNNKVNYLRPTNHEYQRRSVFVTDINSLLLCYYLSTSHTRPDRMSSGP